MATSMRTAPLRFGFANLAHGELCPWHCLAHIRQFPRRGRRGKSGSAPNHLGSVPTPLLSRRRVSLSKLLQHAYSRVLLLHTSSCRTLRAQSVALCASESDARRRRRAVSPCSYGGKHRQHKLSCIPATCLCLLWPAGGVLHRYSAAIPTSTALGAPLSSLSH